VASGRRFGDLTLDPDAEKARSRVNAFGIASVVITDAVPTTKMMTKKQVTAAMIAMLGAVAFELNAAAEQKFQKLTGAQIRTKFPGMELTDEAHWGEVF
jgi:hypothetical protein